MEILLDEPIDLDRMADLCAAGGVYRGIPEPRNRKLWHVTNLLKSEKIIIKGDIRYIDDDPVPSTVRSCGYMGRIWESAVDYYMYDYARRKGGFYLPDFELAKENILGSLDGVMYWPEIYPDGWIVCESKLKFSIKAEIPETHLQQVRSYCHLADTNLVCYVSGHISTTPPSVWASIRVLKLPQSIIDETWQSIINTKNFLMSKGLGPKET